jgi:hypothetical protein
MKTLFPISFILILFVGCENGPFSSSSPDNVLPSPIKGIWINKENSRDTLYINNDSIFTRSHFDGIPSIFKYALKKDSITVRYIGPNKILVPPVTNYFTLENDKLTIYLTKCTYEFDCKIVYYLKY